MGFKPKDTAIDLQRVLVVSLLNKVYYHVRGVNKIVSQVLHGEKLLQH